MVMVDDLRPTFHPYSMMMDVNTFEKYFSLKRQTDLYKAKVTCMFSTTTFTLTKQNPINQKGREMFFAHTHIKNPPHHHCRRQHQTYTPHSKKIFWLYTHKVNKIHSTLQSTNKLIGKV